MPEASRGRSAGVWLGMEGKDAGVIAGRCPERKEGVRNNRWAWPPFHGRQKKPRRKPGLQVQGHSLESSPDGTSLVAEDGRAKWRMRVGLKMISGRDLPGNMLGGPHILSGHLEESLAAFRGLVACQLRTVPGAFLE